MKLALLEFTFLQRYHYLKARKPLGGGYHRWQLEKKSDADSSLELCHLSQKLSLQWASKENGSHIVVHANKWLFPTNAITKNADEKLSEHIQYLP